MADEHGLDVHRVVVWGGWRRGRSATGKFGPATPTDGLDGLDISGGEGIWGMGQVAAGARVWGRPHVQCTFVYVRVFARVSSVPECDMAE